MELVVDVFDPNWKLRGSYTVPYDGGVAPLEDYARRTLQKAVEDGDVHKDEEKFCRMQVRRASEDHRRPGSLPSDDTAVQPETLMPLAKFAPTSARKDLQRELGLDCRDRHRRHAVVLASRSAELHQPRP